MRTCSPVAHITSEIEVLFRHSEVHLHAMVQKIGVGEIVAAFGVAIFARQVPQFVGSIIGPIDAVSRSVGQREFVAAL